MLVEDTYELCKRSALLFPSRASRVDLNIVAAAGPVMGDVANGCAQLTCATSNAAGEAYDCGTGAELSPLGMALTSLTFANCCVCRSPRNPQPTSAN